MICHFLKKSVVESKMVGFSLLVRMKLQMHHCKEVFTFSEKIRSHRPYSTSKYVFPFHNLHNRNTAYFEGKQYLFSVSYFTDGENANYKLLILVCQILKL